MFRDLCRMPIAEKETLIWEALSIFHNSFFIYIMWNAFSRVVIYSSERIYMLQYWVTACNCPSNKANSNVLFRSKKLILTLNCTSLSFAKRKQFFDVLTCYEIWLSFLGDWRDFVERTSLPHFDLDVFLACCVELCHPLWRPLVNSLSLTTNKTLFCRRISPFERCWHSKWSLKWMQVRFSLE